MDNLQLFWDRVGGDDVFVKGTSDADFVTGNFTYYGLFNSFPERMQLFVNGRDVGTISLIQNSYDPAGQVGFGVFAGQLDRSVVENLPNGWYEFTTESGESLGKFFEVTCFFPGTRIATPEGEVPVETLRPGDLVLTADGRALPVRWLGRQTVSTRFGDPLRTLPIRIGAGALGDGLPVRDLLVSPAHALLVDGVLVEAGALVNGTTIRRERNVPEIFPYFHVELAEHTLLVAEGAPAESFVDNAGREHFDNWSEHEAAHGDAPIAEMDLPRATSWRQVPAAIRRRLDAAARSVAAPAAA